MYSPYIQNQEKFQYNPCHVVICAVFINVGCCFSSIYTILPLERNNMDINVNISAFLIQMSMANAFYFAGCICGILLSISLQQWAENFTILKACLFLSSFTCAIMGLSESLGSIVFCRFCLGLLALMALDSLVMVSIHSVSDHLRLVSSASIAVGYGMDCEFLFVAGNGRTILRNNQTDISLCKIRPSF